MTNTTKVTVIDKEGKAHIYRIAMSNNEPWCLKLENSPLSESEFQDRDLFKALCRLREQFEKRGEKIVCAGARLDVFPSGMSREMTGGRKAYVMRLGHQATKVVDIFDVADPLKVSSVADQKDFRIRWIRSLQL